LPYRESFRVRSYEVDPRSRLSPRALCAYLQEVAGVHATQLGASMERLGESGLAWVLHRLKLEVRQQALLGDTLEVLTWPTRFDRVLADRDFVVTGHCIGPWGSGGEVAKPRQAPSAAGRNLVAAGIAKRRHRDTENTEAD